MVIFRMEDQEQNLIDDGEYIGELADVVEVNGQHGPCVRFVFKLVGEQYEGLQASILVGQKLTPGNKLDSLLRALGVEPLELGENSDSDSLLGRKARIYVEQTVNNKSGKVYSNITKVKPFKAVATVQHAGQKPVQAPVQQPAPAQAPAPAQQPAPVQAPVSAPAQQPAPVQQPAPAPSNVITF